MNEFEETSKLTFIIFRERCANSFFEDAEVDHFLCPDINNSSHGEGF